MWHSYIIAVFLLLILVQGCGKQELPKPPSPTITNYNVGHTCNDTKQCNTGLYCELNIEKGYCTKNCQRSTDCPKQSVCARITLNEKQHFLRCIKTCQTNNDCRPAFICYHPSKAWQQICIPSR